MTVIIPAYNEEARLPPTLDRVVAYLSGSGFADPEVLVVNDGSSDQTSQVVRAAADRADAGGPAVRLLENPGNRGKGYSVRNGMGEARGEWVLFSDADLSAPIEELDKLWEAAKRSGCEVAIGSRAIDRSLIGTHQSAFRETSGRIFNLFVRMVTGLPFSDTQCGFKLFSRRASQAVAAKQRLERFGFDVEQLFLARREGFGIEEVPVRWDDVEGTKVGMLAGIDAFLDVLRVRWNALTGKYR